MHYISMIGDQKFFDQMRGQTGDKERPLLRAIVGANQKNNYDSRYGKSKSVSLQDDGIIEDRPVSEDFGNDSNYGDNETPGKKFGDTIHEVPHQDSIARDEFHFKSRTIYSQASETKPERIKESNKHILREINIAPKGPDETRSEALPKSKNRTGSDLLPSVSKPTCGIIDIAPQAVKKPEQGVIHRLPSLGTQDDIHIEPKGGIKHTSEVKLTKENPKPELIYHQEVSKPTINQVRIELQKVTSKVSAAKTELEPVSVMARAPRPISALHAEDKTSNFSVKNLAKLDKQNSGLSPSLDEIGSSLSKFEQIGPHKRSSRRSVELKQSLPKITQDARRISPNQPYQIPTLSLKPNDINLESMGTVISGKERPLTNNDRVTRWTKELSTLGQEDGDWSRGVKYTEDAFSQGIGKEIIFTPHEKSNGPSRRDLNRDSKRGGTPKDLNQAVTEEGHPAIDLDKYMRPEVRALGSKSSRGDMNEETAQWRNSVRGGESSKAIWNREQQPEKIEFGASAINLTPEPKRNLPPVDFYTAEELARARNQIKVSIENMFDMKQEMSSDGELAQLIARFYHLMMDERNHLGKDKLEIVLDLVAFYQSYVKKLKGEVQNKQNEIKSKQSLVELQKEKSTELEKAVRTMNVQVREVHEEKFELSRKLKAMELAHKENDHRVKQVEQRYHENITKFKDMLRVVNQEVAFTRQSEMKAYEKVNALKHEYDKIYNENITLKTQVTNLDYKTKENQFEVDRLIEEVRGHTNRNQGLLNERDMLAARIRDYQLKMAELEGTKVEVENQRARSHELQRNLDSMRAELRNRDLQLMEMEHKVKYNENVKNLLLEENNRIIEQRSKESAQWRAKVDDMQDNGNKIAGDYYADRLNQSGATLKKAAGNALKSYPEGSAEFGKLGLDSDPRRNRGVSYGNITNPSEGLNTANFGTPTRIMTANSKATPNSKVTAYNRISTISKPVDQMSDQEIRNLVQEYNTQLSNYQDKKVILDSMMCRLPEKPKTQKVVSVLSVGHRVEGQHRRRL
jgi:hypothetical protein